MRIETQNDVFENEIGGEQMDKQATHVVMLSDMEPGTKIPDGATVINDEGAIEMERLLKIENSANTTKLSFAGLDMSTCVYGVRFDHFVESNNPQLELKIDTIKFMKILAKAPDSDIRAAWNAIQKCVAYYREYFGVSEICRPE